MGIKVSVIIPVFNAEKYLHECLDSVVNQTLKEIEIICVDDGSTDGSMEILREYEVTDGRFLILSQENSGSGPARNKGILSAKGEFVVFIDADDYYPENTTLDKLFSTAKEHRALICGGSFSTLCVDGSIKTTYDPEMLYGYTFFYDREVSYRDYQFDYGYHRFIYNRGFLLDNKLFFPPYRRFQDPPFFVKTMITAKSFYAIHDITYCYRESNNYIRSLDNRNKFRDWLLGLKDVLSMAKDNQLHELYHLTIMRCCVKNQALFDSAHDFHDPEIDYTLCELEKEIDLHFWDPETITEIAPDQKVSYIRARVQEGSPLPYSHFSLEHRRQTNKQVPEYVQINSKYVQSENPPKVSVIVPVYNVEQYLRECLDSILNQTINDFEVICVNDGSTDDSLCILKEYQAEDSRITVISQINKGLSGARNKGMKYAKGDYIYFIDSDDVLDLNALNVLTHLATEQNLDAVAFGIEPFYESEQLFRKHKFAYYDKANQVTEVLSGFAFMKQMKDQGSFVPSACRAMWRRTTLQDNGIFFPEGIIHEDNLFSFLAYMCADRVMQIPDKFYKRRVRDNSIMTVRKSHKNVIGYFTSAIGVLEYALAESYSQEKEKEIVRTLVDMIAAAKRDYLSLLEDERNKVAFHTETENYLFTRIVLDDIKAEQIKSQFEQDRNRLFAELSESRNSLQVYQKEVDLIRASWTYKIGRFWTFIPRKLRGGYRCLKENGWRYTMRRFFWHLGLK